MTTHKQKKKKARETLAKQRVAKRRVALRKRREEEAERDKVLTFKPPKAVPYRRTEDVKARLEHNLQLLKALEEEYKESTGNKEGFTEEFHEKVLAGLTKVAEQAQPATERAVEETRPVVPEEI